MSAYLQDEQEEKVGVGDPLELLKEVEWEEGQEVVLGRLNGVFLCRQSKQYAEGQAGRTHPLTWSLCVCVPPAPPRTDLKSMKGGGGGELQQGLVEVQQESW